MQGNKGELLKFNQEGKENSMKTKFKKVKLYLLIKTYPFLTFFQPYLTTIKFSKI